jgi:hypothetical protein
MALSREIYENWIRDTIEPRCPELVRPIRDALDAFDAIQRAGRADAERLMPIVEAAQSHRRPLYDMAVGLLQELTADFAEARESVARMASDKRSQVRFNAVISLGARTPRDFSGEVIRQALRDKSAKVRQKAADWAQRRGMAEIVPDLAAALAVESHAATKETMEFNLPLLRDRYLLKKDGAAGFLITIPYARGISTRRVSQEELDAKGISAIIAEVQSKKG